MPKRSINAKAVAKDVKTNIRKRTKIVLGKILEKRGYSKSVQTHPDRVTNTESYKEEMFDFLKWAEREEKKVCKEMSKKNLSKIHYLDLTRALVEIRKQVALAGGKPTDNIIHTVQFRKRL